MFTAKARSQEWEGQECHLGGVPYHVAMRQRETARERGHVLLILANALPVLVATVWVSSHIFGHWVHYNGGVNVINPASLTP